MTLRTATFLVLLVLWTVALLSPVPQASAEQTLGSPTHVFLFGKALHVSVYALLTIVGSRFGGYRCITPLMLIGHAALTEALQPLFNRGGSLRDVGLDVAGIALGTGLHIAFRRRRA